MPSQWIDLQQCHSLAVLVETVAAPLMIHSTAAYCLESDIDTDLNVPGDPGLCGLLVESLIRSAMHEMPSGGDLVITACETDRGVELEIADSGSDVETRSQTRPLMAHKLGATLRWKDCPQGGGSVTITFSKSAGSVSNRSESKNHAGGQRNATDQRRSDEQDWGRRAA